MTFLIAFISGTMLALAGVGYRLTSMGKGNVMQATAALSLSGAVVFGIIAAFLNGWSDASWSLILIAGGVGVCQYVGMLAFRQAMKSESLSPVWCATSLQFMPAVILAALLFPDKEPFTWFYFFALLCVIAAIVSASFGGQTKKETERKKDVKGQVFFGLMLFILMVCFSSFSVMLKVCKHKDMLGPGVDNVFLSVLYGTLLIFCVIDMICLKTWTSNWKCWTGMGLNSAGSLVAFGLQLLLLNEPATLTFALPNTISILTAALISTLFLHEKRTPSWYVTLVFSIAAIVLMVVK